MNKSVEELDISVEQIFKEYSWPGNVRELRNVIESSFNMTEDEYISLIDIPEYLSEVTFEELQEESTELRGMSLSDNVDAYEKKLLVDTLQQVRSISEASRVLKMTRQAIKYKIEKYDIDYKELWK